MVSMHPLLCPRTPVGVEVHLSIDPVLVLAGGGAGIAAAAAAAAVMMIIMMMFTYYKLHGNGLQNLMMIMCT
jgi:hypothetical protein